MENQGLGLAIPYTDGQERSFLPDFIVRVDGRRGREEPLNLIVDVSGEKRKDRAPKTATARSLWMPAINNHGGYGRWAFLEITGSWDAKGTIQAAMRGATTAEGAIGSGV